MDRLHGLSKQDITAHIVDQTLLINFCDHCSDSGDCEGCPIIAAVVAAQEQERKNKLAREWGTL